MLRRCGVATCARRLAQRRYARGMRGVAHDSVSVSAGADREAVAVARSSCSSATRRRPTSVARRLLAALHVRQQIGAAGDEHARSAPSPASRSRRLGDGARRAIREARQPHHGAPPRDASRLGLSRLRGFSLPLPSPPSHGGGTCSGSGHGDRRESAPGRARRLAGGLRVERLQDLLGRDRHLVDAHADRVVDRVGDRRHDRQQRPLADFLGAERAVADRDPRSGR